jgi:hypothetical protein
MVRFSLRNASSYHSLQLRVEDPGALKLGRPYVIGELFSCISLVLHAEGSAGSRPDARVHARYWHAETDVIP